MAFTQLELLRITVVCSGKRLATCGHELTSGDLCLHHQQDAEAGLEKESWYSAITSCVGCALQIANRPHYGDDRWRSTIEGLALALIVGEA